MNFQDVIRESYDSSNKALKVNLVSGTISASGQATVTLVNTPTIYAVVNTSAAGDSVNNIGFATVAISNPTLYAVVNTSAPGVSNSIVTVANPNFGIVGNVTITDSKTYIGLTTSTIGNNPILGPGVNNIGFATVAVSTPTLYAVVNTGAAGVGNSIVTVANPNFGINAGVNYIGFATVDVINAWPDPNTYIGLVTVTQASSARTIIGNITLSDPKTYVGLNTVTIGLGTRFIGIVTVVQSSAARTITGNLTLSDAKTYIGLVTNTIGGPGTVFIGLVTAWSRNAGTSKTLISVPIGLGNNSLSTIAVPTSANKINVTNFLLNSNITTEIAIKSGVTYLTGNASLGITLFPGGGFELPGAPDSPSWIGLPSGSLVVEKRDSGGTVSKIGGGVIYFDE